MNMRNRSATLTVLLSALIALVLLIGWSFVGPAMGGSGTGGSDGPKEEPKEPDSPGPNDPNPDEPGPNPNPYPHPNPPDPEEDSDGDFIPDELEPKYNTDQFDWDSDNDHLADSNEFGYTDPNIKDTDNDGI